MRFELTDVDGVAVLAVHGEVDVATAPRLRSQLVELATGGSEHVVVDLDGVDFLDSTGLGVLVSGLKRFRTVGGDMAVVCTQPRVMKLFDITGLTEVFKVRESVAAAVVAVR